MNLSAEQIIQAIKNENSKITHQPIFNIAKNRKAHGNGLGISNHYFNGTNYATVQK